MSATRKVMIANWKMAKTRPEARAFLQVLQASLVSADAASLPEIVICPPFTALETLLQAMASLPVAVGAQTMAAQTAGAYTGEVSPVMLQELGLRWVIIGHSERRQYYAETDDTVAAKAVAALAHQLTPVVCVGETLAQRDAGQADSVVTHQVNAVMATGVNAGQLVFAYEPVWAIGTGKVCDAVEAGRMCRLIESLAPGARVLYGGSVKPDNVDSLMAQPGIDGGLVGGASLDPASFMTLVLAARQTMAHVA